MSLVILIAIYTNSKAKDHAIMVTFITIFLFSNCGRSTQRRTFILDLIDSFLFPASMLYLSKSELSK